jgi:hypothetical protein
MLATPQESLCKSPEWSNCVLDTLLLPELQGLTLKFTGIDHPEQCRDLQHFDSYAWPVDYCYNSRGFRDQEWPNNPAAAIWCIGDSFTCGVGSTVQHTWPYVLSQTSDLRTINISMDGASNEWIARRCCDIYNELQPLNIVIMWSYLHRRESTAGNTDINRRIYHVKSTVTEDYENFIQCRQQVQDYCTNSNIVELVIPDWQPTLTDSGWQKIRDAKWPQHAKQLTMADQHIIKELTELHGIDRYMLLEQLQHQHRVLHNLIEVPQLDLARDGHHFDRVTADWVSAQVVSRLR